MITECHHTFILGPFIVQATHKETVLKPFGVAVYRMEHRLEHCTQCGALRLPGALKEHEGESILNK